MRGLAWESETGASRCIGLGTISGGTSLLVGVWEDCRGFTLATSTCRFEVGVEVRAPCGELRLVRIPVRFVGLGRDWVEYALCGVGVWEVGVTLLRGVVDNPLGDLGVDDPRGETSSRSTADPGLLLKLASFLGVCRREEWDARWV